MSYIFKKTANLFNCNENNMFGSLNDCMMEICDCYNNTECIVTGTIHAWNFPSCGRETNPYFYHSIADAIYDMIRKSDSSEEDVTIKLVKGAFELTCPHHDGTNTFVIRALNEKGLKVVNNHREYGDYLNIQPKDYWFTKCVM